MKMLHLISPRPYPLVHVSTDDFGDEFIAVSTKLEEIMSHRIINAGTWGILFDLQQELNEL